MKIEDVRALVASFDLPPASEVLINPAVENGVLISLRVTRDSQGRRSPSGSTLAKVRNAVAAAGATAEYLLIDKTTQQIEDGIRASLVNSFPDVIRNSYLTISNEVANVWIDKKRNLTPDEIVLITAHIRTHAELFKMQGAKLHITSDFSIATPTEVLRVVRRLSPAGCEEVSAELKIRGFSVPSLAWVNHRFDLLRKQGLLVRVRDRQYVLTSRALHQLGTIKGKRSPDISRLLALARAGS